MFRNDCEKVKIEKLVSDKQKPVEVRDAYRCAKEI